MIEINANAGFGRTVTLNDRDPALLVDGGLKPWALRFTIISGDAIDIRPLDGENTRGDRQTVDPGKSVRVQSRMELRTTGSLSVLHVEHVDPQPEKKAA